MYHLSYWDNSDLDLYSGVWVSGKFVLRVAL